MMTRRLIAISMVAACSGCAPLPQMPQPALPPEWSVTLSSAPTSAEVPFWSWIGSPVLSELIGEALVQNHDVKEAMARIDESRALARSAGAEILPQVGAQASMKRDRQSENGRFPMRGLPNPVTERIAAIDASWELDLFGRLRAMREQASWHAEASRLDAEAMKVALTAEVAQRFLERQDAQRQYQALQEQAELARQTADLLGHKSRAGLVADYDRLRADALLAEIEAQAPLAQARMAELDRVLGLLTTGRAISLGPRLPHADAWRLSDDLPPMPSSVPADLLERRPDLLAIKAQLQASRSAVSAAEAARWPSIELGLRGGFLSISDGRFTDSSSQLWNVGPSVNIPVFSGGALSARAESQRARFEQVSQRWQQTAQRAVLEVETSAIRMAQGRVRLQTLDKTYHAQEEILHLSRTRYASGLNDFDEVLDAGRQLLTVRLDLISQQTQMQKDAVALYKALGGGWQNVKP